MSVDKFYSTSYVCIECRNKRKDAREAAKEEKSRIKAENIEQMWWLKCTPEEIAKIKTANKKARKKRYKEKHKENLKNEKRRYYAKYPGKKKELKKRYLANHPEKRKEQSKLSKHRREAKQKLLPFSFTGKEWNICRGSFNNKCCYCGKETDLQQDHFVPLAKNGEYTKNNIVPACPSCNVSKSDKDFFEWYPQQSFYSKKRERAIMKYLNYQGEFQQIAM